MDSIDSPASRLSLASLHVPESRFGIWFIGTRMWAVHVVRRALTDLERLIGDRRTSYPTIVDFGCGWGHALILLQQRFQPRRLIGVDIDPAMIAAAARAGERVSLAVEFQQTSGSRLDLPDQSVDLVFCHQTFHHLVDQEETLREFHRVLKPGGLLLFAESTRAYIHSWLIRLLFRHPMEMQRSAPEFLAMIGRAGFAVEAGAISYPYLWWSRPDLGLAERWLGIAPPAEREETLINLVAMRSR